MHMIRDNEATDFLTAAVAVQTGIACNVLNKIRNTEYIT